MIEKPKKTHKRHKMTEACDISSEVRKIVYERDSADGVPCCIISGSTVDLEVAHYIPRSRGGMGIPENLVLLEKHFHKMYDEGTGGAKYSIQEKIENHLRSHYPNWDRSKLIYDRWKETDPAWRF